MRAERELGMGWCWSICVLLANGYFLLLNKIEYITKRNLLILNKSKSWKGFVEWMEMDAVQHRWDS